MKKCEKVLEECSINERDISNVDKDKELKYSSDPNATVITFTHDGKKCHENNNHIS